MSRPYPVDNPLLHGAFEPIRFECDYADLIVEGELPHDLGGTFYRIGPNPQYPPRGAYNPLQGEGMVHAFRLTGNRVSYRNRWVHTRRWVLERQAGRALFSTSNPRDNDPDVAGVASQGAANTNIVSHAGRLLALGEGNAPVELNHQTLATIAPFDFAGRLPSNMTAHPKIDPQSGEMLFFANFPTRKFDGRLAFYVADKAGTLIRSEQIDGPYSALVHDFAITQHYVVFIICPVTLSSARLRSGGSPIAWEPELGTFVGIMPRDGSGLGVRWFSAPTCMVWHTLNAYEDGDRIQIELCQQDAPAFPSINGRPVPEDALRQFLIRWTIELTSNCKVQVQRLSDVVCEYPRIDERWTGLHHRYGYVAAEGGPGTGDILHRSIGRYDNATGEMRLWRAPMKQAVSEPVFAPRLGSSNEGVGYVLATVFCETRNASHMIILDAESIEAGPVARVHLDHRIPAGFHGSFVSD